MARITVTQLRSACLDPEWIERWMSDPANSERSPRRNFGREVPRSRFCQIIAMFTAWLAGSVNQRASAKIKSPSQLWDALWNTVGRDELLELTRSGAVREADHLCQALQNWCKHVSSLRRPNQKSWSEILLTAEYQLGHMSFPTEYGEIIVAGRPEAVRLENEGLVVVDYKISRDSNPDSDFLQAIIYARLLQLRYSKLGFTAQLEYYEPELHFVRQDPQEVRASFERLVFPALSRIAKKMKRSEA